MERRHIRAPVAGRLGEVATLQIGTVVKAGDKLARRARSLTPWRFLPSGPWDGCVLGSRPACASTASHGRSMGAWRRR